MVHPTFIFAIELLGQDAMPWQSTQRRPIVYNEIMNLKQ